jgi:VanZ family protein
MNKLYKFRFVISLIPIAVAIGIFMFSAQQSEESSEMSGTVVEAVVDQIAKINPNVDKDEMRVKLVFPVRKAAHMMEFTALYCSLLLTFYAWQLRGRRVALLSIGLTFLYACSDELHQLFVSGRASRFTDVCIDCAIGAIVTIVFCARASIAMKKSEQAGT